MTPDAEASAYDPYMSADIDPTFTPELEAMYAGDDQDDEVAQ